MSSSHYKGSNDPRLVVKSKTENKVEIYPLALNIAWGGDGRYYHKGEGWDPVDLIQVSWIEIDGSYDLAQLEKGQMYKLSFKVSMKPDAFGWSNKVYVIAKVDNDDYIVETVDLKKKHGGGVTVITIPDSLKFKVPANGGDHKLFFGLYEIWHNNWKGGLSIHKVIIEQCRS